MIIKTKKAWHVCVFIRWMAFYKDMSGELLSKVKRNNKIVVEFKGTSTISRTD